MTATVAGLYRYPVKGLPGEALTRVRLAPGEIFPGDRRYAIAHGTSAWDPAEPRWRPKGDFVTLARVAALAGLQAVYDDRGRLEIRRSGKRVAGGDPDLPADRAAVERFLSAFLADVANVPVRLAGAADRALTDVPEPFVSIVNAESVRHLERAARRPVDPARFRANILLRGLPAWAEFDWIGYEITVGTVRLRIEERIERCAATGVNPESAQRDLNLVRILSEGWGHMDMGVYATATGAGTVAVGDGAVRT
ncbi:MAG: MOSC domain-containing protein [Rhodospirillaceae bacterium]|nr:MOSC domain-containing protein [Rhodospirillaceae bacterium]